MEEGLRLLKPVLASVKKTLSSKPLSSLKRVGNTIVQKPDQVLLSDKAKANKALAALLREADKVRVKAAQELGIDIDRVPRIQGNQDGLLPTEAYGAFISNFNELRMNLELIGRAPERFPLEDVIPHEALVHGYLANVRSAWDHQFPKEVQQTTVDLITNRVRQGESGKIIQKFLIKPLQKGELLLKVKEAVKTPSELPAEAHSAVYEVMQDILYHYNTLVDKAHKFAKPTLSKDGKQKIAELSSTLNRQGVILPDLDNKLVAYVDHHLPALDLLKRSVTSQINRQRKIVWTEIPIFTADERKAVANLLKTLLENPDKYLHRKSLYEMQTLNDEAVKLVQQSIPTLKNVPRLAEEKNSLVNYLNAQVLRAEILKGVALIPKGERLPSVSKPLTDLEIQYAKESFQGYISTIEGNLKIQAGDLSEQAIFDYTVGAWEELLARKTSSKIRLQKIKRDITHLQKINANPSKNLALQEAKTLQAKLENDLKLLDLLEQYVSITKRFNQFPSSPSVAGTLKGIKQKVGSIERKMRKLRQERRILEKTEKHPILQEERPDGRSCSSQELSPKEAKLLVQEKSLADQRKTLLGQISLLKQPEAQITSQSGKALLQERDRLLEEIREISSLGTIHPLPMSFFKSREAFIEYHTPNNKAVMSQSSPLSAELKSLFEKAKVINMRSLKERKNL